MRHEDWTRQPRRWDIRLIRRFMVSFGLLSSLFDFLTFAVLWFALRSSAEEFRSGWLVESVISATLIVLVVRTRRPSWRSRPSGVLTLATLLVAGFVLALPFMPFAALFGFTPLRWPVLGALLAIVAVYIAAAEGMKRFFYRFERRR